MCILRKEYTSCGRSSSGRAPPCQGGGSEFEPRRPLQTNSKKPVYAGFLLIMVTWPSGKARVCKTLIRQFKSARHLHKTVMKKMSQPFLFVVASKIGDFANRFLNTVLQCCPTIFGWFAQLDAHFSCRFPEFGRGGGNFFEKKQNKSCCFQNVFNFLAANFLLAAGIFCFFRQFSVSFRIFHFLPIHKIGKRGYQIQQIQFAMQKAASNTRKTITVSHSAIRHFLARLHSLVTAVAAGISVALTVLTAGAAATAIASKSTTAAGWKHCIPVMRTNYIVGFARSCMQAGMPNTTSENHEGLHRNHCAGYQISVSVYQNIHPGSYQFPWLETLSLVCKVYRQRRR